MLGRFYDVVSVAWMRLKRPLIRGYMLLADFMVLLVRLGCGRRGNSLVDSRIVGRCLVLLELLDGHFTCEFTGYLPIYQVKLIDKSFLCRRADFQLVRTHSIMSSGRERTRCVIDCLWGLVG